MKRALIAGLAALFLGTLALPATADSIGPETFDVPFIVSDPLNATGTDWTYTGGSSYDVELEASGIDGPAVRISNGTMSGSFGDWLFSKPLADAATETGINKEFVAEFDLASMLPDELQPGLQISVAPQTAGGARMSFLKFTDTEDGIVVGFADVMNLPEASAGESWRNVDIALLDRSDRHHVKIVMDLYEGPHNDVVQVYIDGSAGLVPGRTGEAEFDGFFAPVDNQPTINKAKAGQTIPMKWRVSAPSFATSWEDYYRFNGESNAGIAEQDWTTRKVDSLIFQARCVNDPNDSSKCANDAVTASNIPVRGNGFLIDNVTYRSTATPTLPIATESVTDSSAYGSPVFTTALSSAAECSPLGGDIDSLESYASPGASGLTYNEATGVWHYNVQTPKSWAGKCVEMTLNGFNESTQFKFVK